MTLAEQVAAVVPQGVPFGDLLLLDFGYFGLFTIGLGHWSQPRSYIIVPM